MITSLAPFVRSSPQRRVSVANRLALPGDADLAIAGDVEAERILLVRCSHVEATPRQPQFGSPATLVSCDPVLQVLAGQIPIDGKETIHLATIEQCAGTGQDQLVGITSCAGAINKDLHGIVRPHRAVALADGFENIRHQWLLAVQSDVQSLLVPRQKDGGLRLWGISRRIVRQTDSCPGGGPRRFIQASIDHRRSRHTTPIKGATISHPGFD
jgi:hypothetical protein